MPRVFSDPGIQGSRFGALALRVRRMRIDHEMARLGLHRMSIEDQGLRFQVYVGREKGPPLVLLHGFLDSSQTFRRMLPYLHGYRLFLIDAPGFGGTQLPAIRELWHLESIARCLLRFLSGRMCLRGAGLLSHSMGGFFAIHMQREFQRAFGAPFFSRMHMIAPGVLRFPAAERDRIRRRLFPRTVNEIGFLLKHLYHRSLPELPGWVLEGILRDWTQPGYFLMAENTVEDEARVFFDPKDLSDIGVPVRLYWGEEDGLTPISVGERMARSMPDARLLRFHEASHALHLEDPERMAREFLRMEQELGF